VGILKTHLFFNSTLHIDVRMSCSCFRYCAHLIYSWGGILGTLDGTAEGDKLIVEMQTHSMLEVRNLVDHLMAKEYDLREPIRQSEQEFLQNWEVSLKLIVLLHESKEKVMEGCHLVQNTVTSVLDILKNIRSLLIPYLGLVPMKGSKLDFISEFDTMYLALTEEHERLETRHIVVKGEDGDNQIFAIDSDEETRLFEELDQLMDAQERAQAFKGNAHKFMANSVQKVFRQISELENAFRLVRLTKVLLLIC
jgi:hypothetical protein